MKTNFICLIIVSFLLLFFTQVSFSQIISTIRSGTYSQKQIDLNISNLPANFHGNDLKSLTDEIIRRGNLTKDEFETTSQFRERVEKERKKNLTDELTYASNLALELNQTKFQYDADRKVMNANLIIMPNFIWSAPCQNSNTTFEKQRLFVDLPNQDSISLDLNFDIEIEKAKKIKSNLRTLIIASLLEKNSKYYESDNLNIVFKEIWLYDLQTGEIFLKHNNSDYKKLKEDEAKQEREKRIKQISSAKTLYENGKDDEALAELRQVLRDEPMNAEAYLLLGKIHFRREDIEQAVSSLKTALFWDNKLIEAHIMLGKVYLHRGDCLQAKNYSASALTINSENQDAIDLQKQVEKCSR